MTVLLKAEAARCFRLISELSHALGVIDSTHFKARLAYLRELVSDDVASGDAPDAVEVVERGWDSSSSISETAHPDLRSRTDGPNSDWLHFVLGRGRVGKAEWVFWKGDPDPHPSVPHGHWNGYSFPKLDPYLGWIHDSPISISSRMTRDQTRELWNDDRFRDFVSAALLHFAQENPTYIWRVPAPLRLPRRR